jgi:hypothetical protein
MGVESEIEVVASGTAAAIVRLHAGLLVVDARHVDKSVPIAVLLGAATATITSQGVQVTKLKGFPSDELTPWREKRSRVAAADVFLNLHDNLDVGGLAGDGAGGGRIKTGSR